MQNTSTETNPPLVQMKSLNPRSLHGIIALTTLVGLVAASSQLTTCFAQSAFSIACPGNMVVAACDPRGTVVTWPMPLLTSNGIAVASAVSCFPPSGSLFPIGTTTVNCEVFTTASNRIQCSFNILVQPGHANPAHGLDTDGNRLNDIWEIIFKAQGLAPDDDTDGDGLTNEQESIAGTDPFDGSFRGGVYVAVGDIDSSEQTNFVGQTVRLRIATTSDPGKFYQFQVAPAAGGPWTNLSRASHCGFTLDVGSTNLPAWLSKEAFFRVLVSDVDEDGDGLTAWEEHILGTCDHSADTGWRNDWISEGTGQDCTSSSTHGFSGNDILVGGSGGDILADDDDCACSGVGRDILIGGFGSDDEMNPNPGFGGAGLDILIGNTGGDRQTALDWIAANLGKPHLREVALAHVGNGPEGSSDPRFVVAVGTGAEFEVSSWSLAPRTLEPTRHADTEPFLTGWKVCLDVLEPAQPLSATLNPFVVGRIGANSNLWLTLRQIDETGTQTELSTERYGGSGEFCVLDYAIAHQNIYGPNRGEPQYLLVTPMIGFNAAEQLEFRVGLWSVDVPTGRITSVAIDPVDPIEHTNLPPKGARLQIVRESDGRFVVSYLNRQAQLEYLFLDVDSAAVLSHYGRGTFQLRLNEVAPVPVVTPGFALGELGSNDVTTLLPGTNCTSQLLVWKDASAECGVNCDGAPVLVTNRAVKWLGSTVAQTLPAHNFALCRLIDSLAVSAVVCESNTLYLAAYKLVADLQPSLASQTTNVVSGLKPGGSPQVKVFDSGPGMRIDSQFDVLTGRLEDGQLRLDRWRVPAESEP